MWFDRRRRIVELRREELRLRSAELRLHMAAHAQVLEPPLALADRVRGGLQWLRANPQWPVGAAAALLVLRPRRALRWAGRAWWGWRTWRRTLRLIQSLARPQS